MTSQGIESSAKSLRRDIEQLLEISVDVVCNNGKPAKYFICIRIFEVVELKLLIDAVNASRFIPNTKQKLLIDKLSKFSSHEQRKKLEGNLCTNTLTNPVTDKVYYTADILNMAINSKQKVTFKYFDWNAKGKKIFKHKAQIYSLSPYGLIWNNDHYYMVGYSENHEKIATFRVDKMTKIELTDTKSEPIPSNFNLRLYSEKVFLMYDGKPENVTLICENQLMTNLIDKFGEKIKSKIIDENHFEITVNVAPIPTFFAWVFSFGDRIKITSPKNILA
ncbi:hypothetical protein FACS1894132_05920 [Clostridia bacterium]|nr:hypothetical protein FACS1894132_05920 [Clostridia bacterium]